MYLLQARRFIVLASLILPCTRSMAQVAAESPTSQTKPLSPREALTPPDDAEALRISKLAVINGRPYDQPSLHDTLVDYATDTYGWSGLARTTAQTAYAEAHIALSSESDAAWGTDFPGFMQRFGSIAGMTVITGNVRLAMELLFHEDLRYIPCHGCSKRAKLANVLLAELTARHDTDGHRFFTLTPAIADFAGPIVAHTLWYPTSDPVAGVISARLDFATRIGEHLFQEFIWERRHHDPDFRK